MAASCLPCCSVVVCVLLSLPACRLLLDARFTALSALLGGAGALLGPDIDVWDDASLPLLQVAVLSWLVCC
jgi:hypothetical protein